jgi:F420-dependent oxidoreductase-like protein
MRTITRRSFLRSLGALIAAGGAAGRSLVMPARCVAAPGEPARVRFGVQTPNQFTTYDEIRSVWEEAEALGYDTAFVFDHFIPIFAQDADGPCLEGWTLLAALAERTKRLRIGVLVTGNTYRYPAVLAKMAATVDHISGGRLILGMGAGWFELEHTAYGIPFYTLGERARRVVEAVKVVKQLFTEKRVTFDGRYYDLKDAPFEPKAVQKPHPPILIGGMGPKVMQPLAARHADIWHMFTQGDDPVEAKGINDRFDAICRRVGRDPSEVERAIFLRQASLISQPADAVKKRIEGYVASGVGHFILSLRPPFDRELLRAFAKDILPAFRASPKAT